MKKRCCTGDLPGKSIARKIFNSIIWIIIILGISLATFEQFFRK